MGNLVGMSRGILVGSDEKRETFVLIYMYYNKETQVNVDTVTFNAESSNNLPTHNSSKFHQRIPSNHSILLGVGLEIFRSP